MVTFITQIRYVAADASATRCRHAARYAVTLRLRFAARDVMHATLYACYAVA